MDISKLTMTELRNLNHQVVARIRELSRREQMAAALNFNVGDRVYFESKKWPLRHPGVVVKVNTKSVQIKTDVGQIWNVAPTLLKHEVLEAA